MQGFLARYRNVTVLALALFAQLLLLGYQVRTDKDVRLIRLWSVTAITPVAQVVHGAYQFVADVWRNYVGLRRARDESERLRAERDRLKLENQSLRTALGAAERLQILTSYQENLASQTLVAEVIGTGANPNSRVVFLDKGSGAGVKPGMAVITPDGIVGKVQSVFPGASLVLLISDMHSAVGVILENSRAHGVMKGTGLNEARIDYVPNEEKVALGEKVYTSGADRIYPKGLLVGMVQTLSTGRDFQEIIVRPGARLYRLEEVLVVTSGVHQDLPGTARPQAPAALLPPPAEEGRDDVSLVPAEQATPDNPDNYVPLTDADRLKKRYLDVGRAQGHTFGEGAPGSKPPDFNLGWTPPARRQGAAPIGPAPPPAAPASPAAAPTRPAPAPSGP